MEAQEMKVDRDKGWNPYLAGSLTGVLLVLSTWVSGKFAGASTTYVRAIGMIEQFFASERVKSMEYFVKEAPIIDWQWMFVIGIVAGSFVSSAASGSFRWKALPDMWEERFGPSRMKRGLVAFFGGAVAMFGARLADG
jgi:hypothetical protein